MLLGKSAHFAHFFAPGSCTMTVYTVHEQGLFLYEQQDSPWNVAIYITIQFLLEMS